MQLDNPIILLMKNVPILKRGIAKPSFVCEGAPKMAPSGRNEPKFCMQGSFGSQIPEIYDWRPSGLWPPISVLWPPFNNLLHSRGHMYLALQHLGPFMKVLTSKLKETENKAQFGGQDISIMLLWPETSKLAYGDHLGCILICQNRSTQK